MVWLVVSVYKKVKKEYYFDGYERWILVIIKNILFKLFD